MKHLKTLLCSLFVICSGLVLFACGDKSLKFDVNKVLIDEERVFTYDGEEHVIEVSYEGVDAEITFALEDDKNNFKQLEDFDIINAGEYNFYYRLSANGYKTFTSTETFNITIQPKPIDISVEDQVWIKSKNPNKINVSYTTTSQDQVELEFSFGEEFDLNSAQYGDEYPIYCSATDSNYVVNNISATLRVSDIVEVRNNDGVLQNCYSSLNDAVLNANSGDTCILNSSIYLTESIEITKDITIDGQNNNYGIRASNVEFACSRYAGKDVASIFSVIDDNARLILKDIDLNGNQVVRGVSAFAGKVVIDNANITNGKKNDSWRSGGVYITKSASFEMLSGKINKNNPNDETYTKYCADLWIGANANGTLASITGGEIESVFVNSNEYSANGAGKFFVNGGKITNVYVEYDSGYGAQLDYKTGEIEHLMIAYKNDNSKVYGHCYEIAPTENQTYFGGKIYSNSSTAVKYENETYNTLNLEKGRTYIFENCTFNNPLSLTDKVGLIFNDCRFSSTEVATILYVTSVSNLIINNCTFDGNTSGGYAIEVNQYSATCENLIISNNIFNTTNNKNVSISIKERLGFTDTNIAEEWAKVENQGLIECQVKIIGNDFTTGNNIICIGEGPNPGNIPANTSTGDFDLLLSENLDALTIYNKYKDHAYVEEQDASKVNVDAKAIYDSTIEAFEY